MSDQELRRTLENLHRELAEVGEVDGDLERLLTGIRADIENIVERQSQHSPTLSKRLGEAVGRFEASHPSLAGAMGAVIDQLARMGV